jgi:APA family basic amino acid/polyamine antiporter
MGLQSFWRRLREPAMSEEPRSKTRFKRTLGLFDATAISVGAIIGAGIFVVTGIVAGVAGSALVVSLIIAAVISLLTASSFVELTAWQPREGSIYEYAHELVSPRAGFLVGWMWMLSNIFTGAAVSLGFAHYFTALIPALPTSGIASVLCLAFAGLNFFGIRQSARLNNVIVVAKLLVLAFFVFFGLAHVRTGHFAPFAPFHLGVLYGACFIFFAYGGFARVAIVADEIKDARRNVPRAILLSLAISTIVYLCVGTVAVGLVGAPALASSHSPLAKAMRVTGSAAASSIISVGAMLATASVLLTSILGVSRMAYAMARRKDLPAALSRLHPKHQTPFLSIWLAGGLMAILVLVIDLSKVVAISTFALLFYYSLANFAALKLKVDRRLYPRVVPILGGISCLALLVFILFASSHAWLIGLAGLLAGAVFYVAEKRFLKHQFE